MSRVAVTAPVVRMGGRAVAGALLLATQFQRLAAIVVTIPVFAASFVLACCLVGWRHRRALRVWLVQLRRSPLPMYLSLVTMAVAVGWLVASR